MGLGDYLSPKDTFVRAINESIPKLEGVRDETIDKARKAAQETVDETMPRVQKALDETADRTIAKVQKGIRELDAGQGIAHEDAKRRIVGG